MAARQVHPQADNFNYCLDFYYYWEVSIMAAILHLGSW